MQNKRTIDCANLDVFRPLLETRYLDACLKPLLLYSIYSVAVELHYHP